MVWNTLGLKNNFINFFKIIAILKNIGTTYIIPRYFEIFFYLQVSK